MCKPSSSMNAAHLLIFVVLMITGYSFYILTATQSATDYSEKNELLNRLLPQIKETLLLNLSKFVENELKSNVSDKSSSFVLTEETDHSKKSQMILLVTFWRSGSSWIGKLLSTIPNSFYVYEPLHMLREFNTTSYGSHVPSAFMQSNIKHLLHCGVSIDFVKHLEQWTAMYPNVNCAKRKCSPEKLTRDCLRSNYKIIKTVRMDLESVEELFLMPSFANLKVVYLVRDPRGIMNSITNHIKDNWKINSENMCPRLRGDLLAFLFLKHNFPNRIFFLRYEDMAIHPLGKSMDLWKFLKTGHFPEDLPNKWKMYLSKSQQVKNSTKKKNPFDINQKSTQDWQRWRNEISEEILNSVQHNCGDVLGFLGYSKFASLKSVRNLSLPLISKGNCSSLPCIA